MGIRSGAAVGVMVMLAAACDKRGAGSPTPSRSAPATLPPAPGCMASFRFHARPRTRLELTEAAVRACPTSSLARSLHGYALLMQHRIDDARAELQAAVQLDADWDAPTRARTTAMLAALRSGAPAAAGERGANAEAGAGTHAPALDELGANAAVWNGPGYDPYIMGTLDSFWGPVGGDLTFANDTMSIPGLTDPSSRPTGTTGTTGTTGPTGGTGSPQRGPVIVKPKTFDQARDCRAKMTAECERQRNAMDQDDWQCNSDCVDRNNEHPNQDTLRACFAVCDAARERDQDKLKECLARIDEECSATMTLSVGTPTTGETGQAALAPGGGASRPCTSFRDCASCGAATACGWCESDRRCYAGGPAGPLLASRCGGGGWKPFVESCNAAARPSSAPPPVGELSSDSAGMAH